MIDIKNDMAAKSSGGGHIKKFLKKADKALQEGVKRADDILDDAVEFGALTAKQATQASKDIRTQAKKEKTKLQEKSSKKISQGILAAKGLTSSAQNDLELLEKLGKLRKAKVITEKEFQVKKKKILGRI